MSPSFNFKVGNWMIIVTLLFGKITFKYLNICEEIFGRRINWAIKCNHLSSGFLAFGCKFLHSLKFTRADDSFQSRWNFRFFSSFFSFRFFILFFTFIFGLFNFRLAFFFSFFALSNFLEFFFYNTFYTYFFILSRSFTRS